MIHEGYLVDDEKELGIRCLFTQLNSRISSRAKI